jgi:hypothetical protein
VLELTPNASCLVTAWCCGLVLRCAAAVWC